MRSPIERARERRRHVGRAEFGDIHHPKATLSYHVFGDECLFGKLYWGKCWQWANADDQTAQYYKSNMEVSALDLSEIALKRTLDNFERVSGIRESIEILKRYVYESESGLNKEESEAILNVLSDVVDEWGELRDAVIAHLNALESL